MTQPAGALLVQSSVVAPIEPADAGFAPDLAERLDKAVADKRVWNLHGLIALRDDRLVLEKYFEGEDRARGNGKIGHVSFNPDTIHDLRSCSKSIIGLLYGIALNQGKVPPPEEPLYYAFPEHADLADKDGRDLLTIQHALTMTMGTDWDESSQFAEPPLHPMRLNIRKVLAVHARRALVGAALGIGMRQNVLAADLVDSRLQPSLWHATPSAVSERFSELIGCPISCPSPRLSSVLN